MHRAPSQRASVQSAELIDDVLDYVQSINWFSRIGEPATDSDSASVSDYLDLVGIEFEGIRYVRTHAEAVDCIKNQFDSNWFLMEGRNRERLRDLVKSQNLNDAVESYLKLILDQITERVMHFANERLCDYDPYLPKVGAGSALESSYLYALEMAAGEEHSKVFLRKIEIFQRGRWPLCLSRNQFVVY